MEVYVFLIASACDGNLAELRHQSSRSLSFLEYFSCRRVDHFLQPSLYRDRASREIYISACGLLNGLRNFKDLLSIFIIFCQRREREQKWDVERFFGLGWDQWEAREESQLVKWLFEEGLRRRHYWQEGQETSSICVRSRAWKLEMQRASRGSHAVNVFASRWYCASLVSRQQGDRGTKRDWKFLSFSKSRRNECGSNKAVVNNIAFLSSCDRRFFSKARLKG